LLSASFLATSSATAGAASARAAEAGRLDAVVTAAAMGVKISFSLTTIHEKPLFFRSWPPRTLGVA
jgi:hypothetical protein